MQREETACKVSECLIRFVHDLRRKGFSVTPVETADVFRALDVLDLSDETEVRVGLRAVLCSTREEYDAFDALFAAFFREGRGRPNGGANMRVRRGKKDRAEMSPSPEGGNGSAKDGAAADVSGKHAVASIRPQNSNRSDKRSFLQALRQSQAEGAERTTVRVPEEQFTHVWQAARHVVKQMRLMTGRRLTPRPKGHRIDLRRTMRRSLSTGGLPVDPARSGYKKQTVRFVLVCDGSRSMAPYAGVFLQFSFALSRLIPHTELYVFSTEVRRVTPALKAVRLPQMPSLAELGAEWGGGTRIGDALARVMRDVGFRLSPVDTVAVVFSDGLDSGDPDRLRRAMRALKRRVHCVVWLNPLAAVPGYEPKARGMQAALPYIDVFAAADDATSFNQLAQRLRKGDSG
jgi:uncharacterized protein with von Willebrand factor type A (vWA) domain